MSQPERSSGTRSTQERRGGSGAGGGIAGTVVGLFGLLALRSILGRLFGRPRRPQPPPVPRESLRQGHELRDFNLVVVSIIGVGFVLSLGLILLAVTWFQLAQVGPPASIAPPPVRVTPQVPPLPPEPRLEAVSGSQLQDFRGAESEVLSSYGWVDRQADVVRIPIDRAMQLLAAQGLPARSDQSARQTWDAAGSRPSGSSSGRVPEEVDR